MINIFFEEKVFKFKKLVSNTNFFFLKNTFTIILNMLVSHHLNSFNEKNEPFIASISYMTPTSTTNSNGKKAQLVRSYQGNNFCCSGIPNMKCNGKIYCTSCIDLTKEWEDKKAKPPIMKKNDITVTFCDSFVETQIFQTFENSSQDSPMEAVYNFILPKGVAINSFKATFGDKTLKGIVKEKQKAKNQYEDEVSKGNTSVLLETLDGKKFQAQLGNILPKTEISITIGWIQKVKYQPSAPSSILQLNLNNNILKKTVIYSVPIHRPNTSNESKANITVKVNGSRKILSLSSPLGELTKISQTSHSVVAGYEFVQKDDRQATFDLLIDYEWDNVDSVSSSSNGKDVTFGIQYAPKLIAEFSDIQSNEFIFFIDKSGSMDGIKMESVIKSTKIFVQSLPNSCKFNLIGFSSECFPLFETPQDYTEENVQKSIEFIDNLKADGGTALKDGLEKCLKTSISKGFGRQIFILTDGDVDDLEGVVKMIEKFSNQTRIFTLGLGEDANKTFIVQAAENGNGQHSFIVNTKDDDILSNQIVELLQKASIPLISDCVIELPNGVNADVIQKLPQIICAGQTASFYIKTNDTTLEKVLFKGISQGQSIEHWIHLKSQNPTLEFPLSSFYASAKISELEFQLEDLTDPARKQNYVGKSDMMDVDTSKTNDLLKEKITQEIIDLSVSHQILSNLTAFIIVNQNVGEITQNAMISEQITGYPESKISSFPMRSMGLTGFSSSAFSADDEECEIADLSFASGSVQESSMFSPASSSLFSLKYQPQGSGSQHAFLNSGSPPKVKSMLSMSTLSSKSNSKKVKSETNDQSVSNSWTDITNQQKFDGHFSIQVMKESKLFSDLDKVAKENNLTVEIIATVYALMKLKTQFQKFESSWKLIAGKASNYLKKHIQSLTINQIETIVSKFF